jgi:hypothetical protein
MRRDPLEEWMVYGEFGSGLSRVELGKNIDQAMKDLALLEEFLENPSSKESLYNYVPRGIPSIVAPQLSVSQLSWIKELYIRVIQRGGSGTRYVQERLLGLLALAKSPSTIPFWVDIFDIQAPPRDSYKKQRWMIAAAALAYLAIRNDERIAIDALLQLSQHDKFDIRTQAVHYLGEAYLYPERPLPEEIKVELNRIAVQDPAFGPRFEARSILRTYDFPVPLDYPDCSYTLKVKFRYAKRISRTIEILSRQTLEDLHIAIQNSLNWDNDHLYSFFLYGEAWGEGDRFSSPFEDMGPYTTEAVIGELGLVKKHKFMYLFDYGDQHEFEVEVVDIQPQAGPGKYPRLIDSRGESPEQYPEW